MYPPSLKTAIPATAPAPASPPRAATTVCSDGSSADGPRHDDCDAELKKRWR